MTINRLLNQANIRANDEVRKMFTATLELDFHALPIMNQSKQNLKNPLDTDIFERIDKIYRRFIRLRSAALRYSSASQYGVSHLYPLMERIRIKNVYSSFRSTLDDFLTCYIVAYQRFNLTKKNETFCDFLAKKMSLKAKLDDDHQRLVVKKVKAGLREIFTKVGYDRLGYYWIIRAFRVLRETVDKFESNPDVITGEQIVNSALEILFKRNEMAPEQISPLYLDTLAAAYFILEKIKHENLDQSFILDHQELKSFELNNIDRRLQKCANFRSYILNKRRSQQLHTLFGSNLHEEIQSIKKALFNFFGEEVEKEDLIWISRADRVLKADLDDTDSTNLDILSSSHKVLKKLRSITKEDITDDFLYTLSAAVIFLGKKGVIIPDEVQNFLGRLLNDIENLDSLSKESKEVCLGELKKLYTPQVVDEVS